MFGAFKDPIPVNALEQEDEGLQRGRGRHGLLPDFRLELPSTQGEPTYRLADLKTIGAVPKWYPSSGACSRRKAGVERRSPTWRRGQVKGGGDCAVQRRGQQGRGGDQ